MRDVVTWFFVLNYAKDHSPVTFIAKDKHFKAENGNLHPDLAADIEDHAVDIRCYKSINQFIKDNSLQKTELTAEELRVFVKDGQLSDLLVNRIQQSKLTNVMVEEIQFGKATKYKIAEDSSYVEARYTVSFRYTEFTATTDPYAPPRSGGFNVSSLPNPGMFNRLGKSILLSELVNPPPIGTQTNYHVVVKPILTFRLVSGQVESLELLTVGEIVQLTKLTEVPVFPSATTSGSNQQ